MQLRQITNNHVASRQDAKEGAMICHIANKNKQCIQFSQSLKMRSYLFVQNEQA